MVLSVSKSSWDLFHTSDIHPSTPGINIMYIHLPYDTIGEKGPRLGYVGGFSWLRWAGALQPREPYIKGDRTVCYNLLSKPEHL